MVFILLVLFVAILLAAYGALESDWEPRPGSNTSRDAQRAPRSRPSAPTHGPQTSAQTGPINPPYLIAYLGAFQTML